MSKRHISTSFISTLPVLSILNPKKIEIKNGNFFNTFLWCLKKVYLFKAPKSGLKIKNLSFPPLFQIGTTRVVTVFLLNSQLISFPLS